MYLQGQYCSLGIPLLLQSLLQDVLIHHLVREGHLQCLILFHCLADRFVSIVITRPAASGNLSDKAINGCKNPAFLLPHPSYTTSVQALAHNFRTINLSTLCQLLVNNTSFLCIAFGQTWYIFVQKLTIGQITLLEPGTLQNLQISD